MCMSSLASSFSAAVTAAVWTPRGRRLASVRALAAFGGCSAVIQLLTAVLVPDHKLSFSFLLLGAVVLVSLAFGLRATWPRYEIGREYRNPELLLTIRRGDILAEAGQIVVGFSDTFDTDTTGSRIISAKSLEGQLLERRFGGDKQKLDLALDAALARVSPIERLVAGQKEGKLDRFPIGTVATIEDDLGNRILGVAYSRMGTDLVAASSIRDLWASLGRLWDEVFRMGQQEPVAMPLIGTKLARIHCVDRESLLRIILLSFMARHREKKICDRFTIVISESDWDKINALEVEAFLASLE